MDRMLYVAMSGARQNELAMAINSNNLANISTTGFRADLAAARSMPLFGGPGHPTRVYSMTEKAGIDFKPGSMNTTGRELDVAITGDGFLAVQSRDGSEAYTRAGDLQINSAGVLQTGAGHPVMGEGGPITIPETTKIEIANDGTISIAGGAGAGPGTTAVIDRIKLVSPDLKELKRNQDGLFVLQDGEEADVDDEVRLVSGTLETSNVNAAAALVSMIELQRQFEMQVKMLKAAEENNQQASQLLKLA